MGGIQRYGWDAGTWRTWVGYGDMGGIQGLGERGWAMGDTGDMGGMWGLGWDMGGHQGHMRVQGDIGEKCGDMGGPREMWGDIRHGVGDTHEGVHSAIVG